MAEVEALQREIKQLEGAIEKLQKQLDDRPAKEQDPYDRELLESLIKRQNVLEDRLNKADAESAARLSTEAEPESDDETGEESDDGGDDDDEFFGL